MYLKPIKESVKAKGHTPQYQMHKYFARRPYNVFNMLIDHYSKEGEIILDCFCGGGVTISEGLSLNRKVIGVDINPLATFITEMQIQQVDIGKLKEYFNTFYQDTKNHYQALYEYDISEKRVTQEWMEWVYEVECPFCGSIIKLDEENKITNGKYSCPNANCESNIIAKPGVKRTSCKPVRSVPVRMKYHSEDGTEGVYYFSEEEKEEILVGQSKLNFEENSINVDCDIPTNWDRWYEDCLPQKGVYKFSDLFSERNYYINSGIFNMIMLLPESKERDLLYFAFSSSLRYTNKMSRVTPNWENGNPICMDKHAYWLPNVYVECNVVDKLFDRMKAVLKGIDFTNSMMNTKKEKAQTFEELQETKDYLILNRSSSDLPIPDESVDAVITDPPYGSNVQYGELSSFWNIWYKQYRGLNDFIYIDEEAVSNRKSCFNGAKDVEFYGNMLTEVYSEAYRVLKPNGFLVFTFNNKDVNVWIQLLKAVVKAGFYLPKDGVIYQDYIKEYKNTSHLKYSGNIHGDFIYSFKKGCIRTENYSNKNFEQAMVDTVYRELKEMYGRLDAYTTTELYEKIYGSLIEVIMAFISNESEDVNSFEDFSKTYIDNLLSEKLHMVEGKWVVKEGEAFC